MKRRYRAKLRCLKVKMTIVAVAGSCLATTGNKLQLLADCYAGSNFRAFCHLIHSYKSHLFTAVCQVFLGFSRCCISSMISSGSASNSLGCSLGCNQCLAWTKTVNVSISSLNISCPSMAIAIWGLTSLMSKTRQNASQHECKKNA